MLNLNQYKNGAILVIAIIANAILVIGSYYLGSMKHDDSKYQAQIANWQQMATNTLHQNTIVNHQIDSLQDIVAHNNKVASLQTDSIKTLQARADSIHKARPEVTQVLSTLPDTCAPAKAVIMNQEWEIQTLRVAAVIADKRDSTRLIEIGNLQVGVKRLQTSNDSLVKVINTVPVYHEPKILGFIPEPSRTMSFVGGILVGVGTLVVLNHQVK